MHDNNPNAELRAMFAREVARLPSQADFENRVQKRIRARRRAHRTKVLTLSALGALLTVVAGAAIVRGQDRSNTIQTQAPATSVTAVTTLRDAAVMIDVSGMDYRDAQQRLAPLNARVLLALENTNSNSEGTVTRTAPVTGQPTSGEIIVYVAWNRATGPSAGVGSPVGSNVWFGPAGLIVGLTSIDPDDRCNHPGAAPGRPIRFLHGELVGCVLGPEQGQRIFVWLDQLAKVNEPIATMPDLVGVAYAEATQRLNELHPAGLAGGITAQVIGGGTSKEPKVVVTSPAAGQPITRLGGVTLGLDGPPSLAASPATTQPSAPTR